MNNLPFAPHKHNRTYRRVILLILPLLLGGLFLAACNRDRAASEESAAQGVEASVESSAELESADAAGVEPAAVAQFLAASESAESVQGTVLARYLPALKPGSEDQIVGMEYAPRYTLDVTLDVASRTLTGTGDIVVTNNSREPWNNIVFRLYPNLQHYGGDMFIHSVALDSLPTNFNYLDANSSMRILLPRPLLPKDKVTVSLKWVLNYPSWVSDSALYRLFGRSQEMVSLPLFYPVLGVYQQGAAIGSGRWWREIGTERGDSLLSDASFFQVRVTLPSDQVPVTSGTLVLSSSTSPTQTQHVWVTGPSREFLLHTSPLFQSLTEEAYGTTITSYYLPGNEEGGAAALRYGVASLRAFSDLYGEYPFKDMRIAPAPLGFRGMEYPQAMLLGVRLYNQMRDNLEVLVVHEMAHQWWYQMVQNDPINTPWMDESIAEYSVKLYFEELRGKQLADLEQYRRWEVPLETLTTRGTDLPIAGAVESFTTGNQYETIVYGKGALFYAALRENLGDRQFRRFLQTYLVAHRWGIVDAEDFAAALHALGRAELVQMYQEWVGTPVQQAAAQPVDSAGN